MFNEDIKQSREKQLVDPDKFDYHMQRARLDTIQSRRKIFSQQSEDANRKALSRQSIKTSIY